MTDLDFDHEDRGRLIRRGWTTLTAEHHDRVHRRATSLGVSDASVVRACVHKLDEISDAEILRAETEVTSRRRVGANKTNSKR